MSGYPHNYGGYGAPPPSSAPTFGGPAPSTGYGAPPPSSGQTYSPPAPTTGYCAPPSSSAQTYGGPPPPSTITQHYGSSDPYGASPQSSAQSYGGPYHRVDDLYARTAPIDNARTDPIPSSATQSYGSSAPYGAPPHQDQSPYASSTTAYSGYSSDPTKPPKENKPSAQYDGEPPPSTNQSYGSSDPYSSPSPPGQYPYAPVYSQPSRYSSDPMKPPKDNKPSASYGGPPPSTTQFHGSPSPYSSSPPPGHSTYAPVASPYSGYSSDPVKPPKDNKLSAPYGGSHPSASYGAPVAPSAPYGGAGASPFAALVPSRFPPGIDPNIVACFQIADQDGSGFIDDKEMQRALSTYNERFTLHTVRLLMYHFSITNAGKIGPKEFTDLFHSLQKWRAIFERFDRDRSGKIDVNELREALLSQGFSVPPSVLELLVSKFDKSSGKTKAIDYENFLECCLTVKGLTEKFKEKDVGYTGSATFTYESFMLAVLPFLLA